MKEASFSSASFKQFARATASLLLSEKVATQAASAAWFLCSAAATIACRCCASCAAQPDSKNPALATAIVRTDRTAPTSAANLQARPLRLYTPLYVRLSGASPVLNARFCNAEQFASALVLPAGNPWDTKHPQRRNEDFKFLVP